MMTDKQIDDLLDAGTGGAPTRELIELQMRINERKRQRQQAAARAAQPKLKTEWHPDDLAAAVAEIRKPLAVQETDMGGMDDLCRNVDESLDGLHNLLCALIAVYRKERAWQRHLSPLEGVLAAMSNVTMDKASSESTTPNTGAPAA